MPPEPLGRVLAAGAEGVGALLAPLEALEDAAVELALVVAPGFSAGGSVGLGAGSTSMRVLLGLTELGVSAAAAVELALLGLATPSVGALLGVVAAPWSVVLSSPFGSVVTLTGLLDAGGGCAACSLQPSREVAQASSNAQSAVRGGSVARKYFTGLQ
jgi:hypothetical protein